jgi:glutaminyl-tRNA synthetase
VDETPDRDRSEGRDFIRKIVDGHVAESRYAGIVTRFPPEPNGYLHIGHAKSIVLNFGLAREFAGRCHLRYDDTNPLTENEEFTRSMQADIRWLGFDWGTHLYFASDYFARMYGVAEDLIRKGLAYVDSASEEEIREARGTVTQPGRPTADRERPFEESLDLFRRMRAGEFDDGAYVLRGKIDLASPNMIMRDPVFYRIRHAHHYRTGDDWPIYPLYDFAHCLEDAFEGVTHSLCTLEFENNREIYDWILDHAGFEEPRPHQYEFARLNLDFTVLSKRTLIRLVDEGRVSGWDDPRMPTIAGLRRRGVPPEAIRRLCRMAGVTKVNSSFDPQKLDFHVRDVLNPIAPRAMAVTRPLRVVITDWPEGHRELLDAPFFPERDDSPSRKIPMSQGLWIEAEDFALDPPKGWKRLAPGREVRLRHGYVIRCHSVIEGPDGQPMTLHCTHDPSTLGRNPEDRKIGGTIHWVAAEGAVAAEFRLFDHLFSERAPLDVPEGDDVLNHLNPASVEVVRGWVEPSVVRGGVGVAALDAEGFEARVQFERLGYFTRDLESTPARPVFNRIVPLRDGWSKITAKSGGQGTEDGASTPATGHDVRRERVVQTDEDRISDARRQAREADPYLAERFEAYRAEHGLSTKQADILTADRATAGLFEAAIGVTSDPHGVASWIANDLQALLPDEGMAGSLVDGASLGRLIGMVADGVVSRRAAKDVLAELVSTGGDPAAIVARDGLGVVGDDAELEPVVRSVLDAWPEKVEAYRAGHHNLLGLFMGQLMKQTGGRADPASARRLLLAALDDA